MTDLNQVVLIGRITRDIGERDYGYTPSGTARLNIGLAVNRSKKTGDEWKDEVNFFDITIWGKMAENLKPFLTKGKQISVVAHLQQDRWEKDGQKYSRVTIHADNVQLLGGKSDSKDQAERDGGHYEPAPAQDNGGDFPEDIPF